MSMEKQEEDVEPCEKGQEVFWTWWHTMDVSLPPGGMLGDWRDQSQGAGARGPACKEGSENRDLEEGKYAFVRTRM
jgi:hypothetical protein